MRSRRNFSLDPGGVITWFRMMPDRSFLVPRIIFLKMIVFMILAAASVPGIRAASVEYSYDAAGRLTDAEYEGTGAIRYTYDPAGNFSSVTADPCLHTGDVNGNGSLSAADAQTTFFIVLGLTTPTFEEACAADCNNNGSISAGDAQLIFNSVLFGHLCADELE